MKQLFENQFQTIYLHENLDVFEQRFKSDSQNIFGEAYIKEMRIFGDYMNTHQTPDKKISKIIINTLDGGPTMEPSVQKWMHDIFYPQISENGIKSKAYCMGEEIVAKLSIELTAEDDPNAMFKFQFFSSLEDGINWLSAI
ncbi:MAG: hypothetical protein ACI8ZM_002521 [Crocinitomix sp.]|jgi:hypothetical protein